MQAMNVKVYNQEGVAVGSVELNEAGSSVSNRMKRWFTSTSPITSRVSVRERTTPKTRQKSPAAARSRGVRKGPAALAPVPSALLCGVGAVPSSVRIRATTAPSSRKQMKRLAIKSVFSAKAKAEKIMVLDKIELCPKSRPKRWSGILGKLQVCRQEVPHPR